MPREHRVRPSLKLWTQTGIWEWWDEKGVLRMGRMAYDLACRPGVMTNFIKVEYSDHSLTSDCSALTGRVLLTIVVPKRRLLGSRIHVEP